MGKISFRENFGKYLIMLNFLDFLYGKLPNQGLFWRSIRYGVRIFTNIYANYFIPVCCKNVNVDSNTIIVSLTSFPARINDVWITIASLLNQDYQNMKVVLWLSRVQFPTMAILPKKLLALQSKGLTIHLVEDDMKPHKKYLYSMQMYPQNSIVTVDDDIIYPPKLISQLVLTSLQYKDCVICTKAVTVSKEKYLCWHSCISPDRRLKMIMPIGVGGVLYPPKTFNYSYLFDTDTIKQTCLYGDDLWLNFMCRLNGTEIVKTTYCPGLITIFASQKASLCKVNDNENRNDAQIESISVWAKNKFGIDFYVCK